MQAQVYTTPLLTVFLKVQRKYDKDYSWPSQLTILNLLDVHQGIIKSRRTLNRWLDLMVSSKYLIRRRRIKRHPEYGMIFKSTLYKITIKGYRTLAAMGVNVHNEIRKYMAWLEEISPRGSRRVDPPAAQPSFKGEVETLVKTFLKSFNSFLSFSF
jgi:hypothetical protein